MIQYSNANNSDDAQKSVIENTHSAALDEVVLYSLHLPVSHQQKIHEIGRRICTENLEGWYKTCFTLSVQDHDTSYISTSVAVIRSTPYSD